MTVKGYRASFLSEKNVLKWTVVTIKQFYVHIKHHHVTQCKWVHCMIYELHLNKAVQKKKEKRIRTL